MKKLTGNIALAFDRRRQLRRRTPVDIGYVATFVSGRARQRDVQTVHAAEYLLGRTRRAWRRKRRDRMHARATSRGARHRHPLLNQLLQPLLRLIEHDEAPEFTPFKVASS